MSVGPNPVITPQKWSGASANVVQAIQSASKRTGVSFDYLMNKAKQESSFNPAAKAGTSSATGLYQFIDSTWLQAVKEYGDELGLGKVADTISVDKKGRMQVSDAELKQEILKLRENPEIAAVVTAEMTKDNASYLENSLGGPVGEGDLYLAHFLGLGGAEKFLKARQDNPLQAAADLFPAAAGSNKNVFYDQSGHKRSIDEVYDFFAKKMATPDNSGPLIAAAAPGKSLSELTSITTANQGEGVSALPYEANLAIAGDFISDNAMRGQRQLLESLLAGVNNFGGVRNDGTLLSPYTSLVLAKLQSPDEGMFGGKNRQS